jgi:hypothetical protein
VPKQNPRTGPGPYLNFACNDTNPKCGSAYPFACINGDDVGPGEGITTVHKLLAGRYEFWIQVRDDTPAGEIEITLRDTGGRVVETWTNPDVSGDERGWHVFDIDGKRGSITTIDALADQTLPRAARDPYTFVCDH